jgi:hypothetical protein
LAELVVLGFSNAHAADKVALQLTTLQREGLLDLADWARVIRQEEGRGDVRQLRSAVCGDDTLRSLAVRYERSPRDQPLLRGPVRRPARNPRLEYQRRGWSRIQPGRSLARNGHGWDAPHRSAMVAGLRPVQTLRGADFSHASSSPQPKERASSGPAIRSDRLVPPFGDQDNPMGPTCDWSPIASTSFVKPTSWDSTAMPRMQLTAAVKAERVN